MSSTEITLTLDISAPSTTVALAAQGPAGPPGPSGTGGAHSALSGLDANDHAQYQLRSEKGQAGGYVAFDDSRLSNARAPTAHTHSISEVVGLQDALDSIEAPVQSELVSLWMDATTGDDSNDGTSQAAPVKSAARIIELVEALPKFQAAPLVIYYTAGASPDADARAWLRLPRRIPTTNDARTWLWGVDHTTIATGATTGATSGLDIPLAVASANLRRGRTLQMTSGPSTGYCRSIMRQSTTATKMPELGVTVANGNTFRIRKPAVEMIVSADDPVLCSGYGLSPIDAPLIIVNIGFRGDVPDSGIRMSCHGSFVNCFGVEVTNGLALYTESGEISMGRPGRIPNDATRLAGFIATDIDPAVFELTTPGSLDEWLGWGVTAPEDAEQSFWEGVFCGAKAKLTGTLVCDYLGIFGSFEFFGLDVISSIDTGEGQYGVAQINTHLGCKGAYSDGGTLRGIFDNRATTIWDGALIAVAPEAKVICSFGVGAYACNIEGSGGAVWHCLSGTTNIAPASGTAVRMRSGARVVVDHDNFSFAGTTYGFDGRGGGQAWFATDPSTQVTGATAGYIVGPNTGESGSASDISVSYSARTNGAGAIFGRAA